MVASVMAAFPLVRVLASSSHRLPGMAAAALLAEALPRGSRVEMYEVPSRRGPVGHGCEFRASKLHGRKECLTLLKLLDVRGGRIDFENC